jgi:hypothetical protein
MKMRRLFIIVPLVVSANFAVAQSGSEKILVPIRVPVPVPGANGSLWSSSLLGRNNSSAALMLGNVNVDCGGLLCPQALDMFGGTTYQIVPSGASDRPAAVVNVPAGRSFDLTLILRVQDLSRQSQTWGSEVPIVRERDLRTGKLILLDIPISASFRNTLRIYDIDGQANARVALRLFALDPNRPSIVLGSKPDALLGEQVIVLRPPAPGDTGRSPGYAEIGDLSQIAPLANASKVAVEVEPLTPGLRIWSFVSVTNNETQHVTIITPD